MTAVVPVGSGLVPVVAVATAERYGGGRDLPAHATVDAAGADLEAGMLVPIHIALLGLSDGRILRIDGGGPGMPEQLRGFAFVGGHAVLSVLPDPRRPDWSICFLRKGRARTDWGDPAREARPARSGSVDPGAVDALMPRRLWLYTNYDCNLACDYCCVVAGPRADPRRLDAERIQRLSDEAATMAMDEVVLTGGEPTLRPDLAMLMRSITDRLPLTLLTNAMLLRGTRWASIRPLIEEGRPVTFQVSLDSAEPDRHDTHRGAGAHARALAGIRLLVETGARVRLAASLPEGALDEIPALHALADELGVAASDRIFRPIALRGAAGEGEPIRPEDIAPELTCDAQGWFWHPISNDPDMRLDLPASSSLGQAMVTVRERLTAMIAAGSAPVDRFVCG